MKNILRKTMQAKELFGVVGHNGRRNDVIYCSPKEQENDFKDVVVFFGGDIQDFSENMNKSKENSKFSIWSLNNMSSLLQSFFTNSAIIVVRPNRIEKNTFSCYDNFVKTLDVYGVPEYTFNYGGLAHLQNLIESVLSTIELNEVKEPVQSVKSSAESTKDVKLKIIGFSKGCVVLNQLLYEFYNLSKSDDNLALTEFSQKITDMYWLDGGHNGGKNVWITSKDILQTLINLGIKVHVHISPYQVRDERRPWIGAEEKIFSETLRKLGAQIERKLHFDDKPADINYHFNVIRVAFDHNK